MTASERQLLLEVAQWVAEQEEGLADKGGTTSNWVLIMRRLIEEVRPKGTEGREITEEEATFIAKAIEFAAERLGRVIPEGLARRTAADAIATFLFAMPPAVLRDHFFFGGVGTHAIAEMIRKAATKQVS
jgi:hypothetical protein